METFVLHMYRTLDDEEIYHDSNILSLSKSPIVSLIDSSNPIEPTRREKIDKYNLRPFEIQQNLMDLIIQLSKDIKIKLLKIEFDFSVDNELYEELMEAIRSDNYKKVNQLVLEARQNYSDIKALNFIYNSKKFRVSKYGVVEIDADSNELQNLAFSTPIKILAGLREGV